MRLIDADKLKAVIIEGYRAEFFGSVLWDILNDIPTAYDINKVVEELEEEKNIHTEQFNISIYKDMPEIKQRYKQAIGIIDKAIEIVKQGVR